jgi:hypothetical protein
MNESNQVIVEVNNRVSEEYVRCDLKPYSKLWQSEYPLCEFLRVEDSPDMFKIIRFETLESLVKLEIHQSMTLELACLQKKIEIIPSLSLSKIEITSGEVNLQTIEDLLEQCTKLNSLTTYFQVRVRRLRGFHIAAIANMQEVVKRELLNLFDCQFTQAGRQLQIKFQHRRSEKQLDLFIQDLSCSFDL